MNTLNKTKSAVFFLNIGFSSPLKDPFVQIIQQYKSIYKSESTKCSFTVEKFYNKTAIDSNTGRHKDLLYKL